MLRSDDKLRGYISAGSVVFAGAAYGDDGVIIGSGDIGGDVLAAAAHRSYMGDTW